jgi:dUTP pyrophosphatase
LKRQLSDSEQALLHGSQSEQMPVQVRVLREPEAVGLPLPSYATTGAAGMDLMAALPADKPLTLPPGGRALITTGLRIALPDGYEAQVRARSGLALRHGIGLVNAPGTIDSDYRGVLQVLLINWGEQPFTVRRGDRIAQLVVIPVTQAMLVEIESLDETERGEAGFGSTGA